MKKLILAAIFIISFGKISAQNEYFQNDPSWLCTHYADPWPCTIIDTNNFYVDGDTLINSTTYKKLKSRGRWIYSTYFQQAPCPYSEYSWQDSLAGCIRSSGIQMYWMPYGDTAEYLLWDFNLTIGSHTPVTYINSDTSHTVTYIDSIYTPTGYRKVFYLNGNNFEFIIEGIGGNAGLMYHPGILFEQYAELLCYSQGDTAYFPSQGPECFLITDTDVSSPEIVSLEIFPNPATDFADVQLAGGTIDLIEVYNIRGQVVKSHVEPRISTAELAEGIYFVRVFADDAVLTKKLLVE
jgi:hypothetical protein